MKKFLLKVSFFAVYAFLLQVVFPIMIDPYNVFHIEHIRANGVDCNKNYVKMKYILNNPERFDSFVFGSSRVGVIHTEKIPGERAYNMAYTGGLPSEHLANIKTFLKNNIHPVKIYIGVDSVSYMVDPEMHISSQMHCPYEYLADDPYYFFTLYCNPLIAFESLKTILTRKSEVDTDTFYQYGWWREYGQESKIDWESENVKPTILGVLNDKVFRNALNDIKETVRLCRENSIELIIFTNPMHNITYMALVKDCRYFEFLEELSSITEFYNFSSLNDITLSNDCYLETSHYKAEVGDMILNVICSDEIYPELYAQGFGVKVTKDNAEEFISMLKHQLE